MKLVIAKDDGEAIESTDLSILNVIACKMPQLPEDVCFHKYDVVWLESLQLKKHTCLQMFLFQC